MNKYQKSYLSQKEANRIYLGLRILFDQNKIYLEEDLSIDSVAERVKTNSKYLSQVINERTKNNFPAFTNQYRLREFKERLLLGEAKRFTFYGLAKECGFATRSTFYRAFKRFVGQTPKEFYFEKSLAA